MASITLDRLTKVYDDGTRAVDEVSLAIGDGEVLVLVGPSGCGKSTALKMIAGLEEITSGEVRIGDRVVNDLEPGQRDIAMVFQSYALYPHMTVHDNMAFALKLRKVPAEQRTRQVHEVAAMLGLEEQLGKKPGQLSGGQRQRVAMGRAIIRRPQAFLMDEPLSNLDAKLRLETRTQIARLQREVGTTMVYVTHDQTEALTLGDRVAVLSHGVVRQVDGPERLYEQPNDLFVASFIGSPPMNLTEARVVDAPDGGVAVTLGPTQLAVGDAEPALAAALRALPDRRVIVGIRPEDLSEPDGRAHAGVLRGPVELRESLGSDVYVHLPVASPPAVTDETREAAAERGDAALQALDRGTTTFVARIDARSAAREGETIELVVDPRGVHFFAPATGRRVTGRPAEHPITTQEVPTS
jgi:multiple sugar transport system ATP-binding protein